MSQSISVCFINSGIGETVSFSGVGKYLHHFGFALEEMSENDAADELRARSYALIILDAGLTVKTLNANGWSRFIHEQVKSGCGVVSFLGNGAEIFPDFLENAIAASDVSSFRFCGDSHYITALHDGEELPLRNEIAVLKGSWPKGGTTVLKGGEFPVCSASELPGFRFVQWNDVSWMTQSILGPLFGLDDVLWRSLVWAARKPFVMLGVPPIVTMRVDDVWGSARSGQENPLYWVETCNRYRIKPWLGLFLDNLSQKAIDATRRYNATGNATVFPHAFSGNEYQIEASGTIEEWIYYNHWRQCAYTDSVMVQNARRVETWHRQNGIAIGKMALPHYYEAGENALAWFGKWGCEFSGFCIPPGSSYLLPQTKPLTVGPFFHVQRTESGESVPVFYGDYLEWPAEQGQNVKLFNFNVEIRDVCGYEWAPNNDVSQTVANGVRQLRRAFDSQVPSSLFTHETDYLQHITPQNWECILKGVSEGIASYNPLYLSLEDAGAYLRARRNVSLVSGTVQGAGLRLHFTGNGDFPLKALFVTEGSAIEERWVDIGIIEREKTVTISL